jgi:N-acetylglucosamine malate deacetylase 2
VSDLIDQVADLARSRMSARTAMVFAQPGHETVACGAQLARFDDLQFVLVTDGASGSREAMRRRGFETVSAYAQARLQEFEEALALAGVSSGRAARLGLVEGALMDQIEPLVGRLAAMLAGTEVIVTYGYQGGYSDHDAVALAVHGACDVMAESGSRPKIIETQAPSGLAGVWTSPWVTATGGGHELTLGLTPDEQALKRAMIAKYVSQRPGLDGLDLREERFRIDRRATRRDASAGAGWLNLAASAAEVAGRREGSRRLEDALAVMREIAIATRGIPQAESPRGRRAGRRG